MRRISLPSLGGTAAGQQGRVGGHLGPGDALEAERELRPLLGDVDQDDLSGRDLSEQDLLGEERIVDLMVAQIEDRLRDKDMGIELTPAAKTLIAKRGFDPVLGARPLRRALQRDIEDILAEKILFGELSAGQIVLVDVAEEGAELPFRFTGVSKADALSLEPATDNG